MRYIVVALSSEASVFINSFKLKLIEKKPFKIYKNNDTFLVVSGIGSINSAIATTYLLTKYSAKEDDFILNIGLAASSFECEIGDVFSISKVIKHENSSIIKLNGEKKLTTFSTPQNSKVVKNSLIDMEGYGFAKAAVKFSKNVKILKVVSDFCEDRILEKVEVERLMKKVLEYNLKKEKLNNSFIGILDGKIGNIDYKELKREYHEKCYSNRS